MASRLWEHHRKFAGIAHNPNAVGVFVEIGDGERLGEQIEEAVVRNPCRPWQLDTRARLGGDNDAN
jgi:hypothetical protein